MQIGAVLSQTELGPEPETLRDYAQAVQDLGFDFLVTADHVVGAAQPNKVYVTLSDGRIVQPTRTWTDPESDVALLNVEDGTLPAATGSPTPRAVADWPQYHRDALRTGAGPATPVLDSPRRAWTRSLDGRVYASPLIVGGRVIDPASGMDQAADVAVAGPKRLHSSDAWCAGPARRPHPNPCRVATVHAAADWGLSCPGRSRR